MARSDYNPIHRFFHGDPIELMDDMYSMSVGDTWLYFHNNCFVGVCHLNVDDDQQDEFYILDDASDNAKKAMASDLVNPKTTPLGLDELVGHALRLVAAEISELVRQRLLTNPNE